MAEFAAALSYVLKHEGGWSNDPDDPGGATMQGITLATARQHGILTPEDLRNITFEQLSAIYRIEYWRFSWITSQRVATKLLDMAVNLGPRTATKLLQGILNALGASLAEDGLWGPLTQEATNAVPEDRMLRLLVMACESRYREIVARRPQSAKFLDGWLKRAAEVPR